MGVLRTRLHSLIVFFLLEIGGVAGIVHAQEVGLFRLRGWGGSLRFRWQSENRFVPRLTRERTFNETFMLRNNGFIINQDLLYFQWSGDLGLFQERYIGQNLHRYARGRLLGQNLTVLLFKSNPTSLVFLWNRNANIITMDYTGRRFYDINNLQATLEMRGFRLPSRLQVVRRDLREVWNRARFRTQRDQLRRTIRYNGRRNGDDSSFEVDYDFLNIRDRIRSTWSFNRHTASVRLRRAFGENRANSLDSKFRLFFRKGLSDYKNARINQLLQLQHLPSLSTRYRYILSATRAVGRTFLQNMAFASINHRLYASLNTNFGAGGSYGTMQEGKTHTLSVSGSMNYTKKIPLSGRLQIGYTRGYSVNDRQIESTEQVVAQERHVFIGDFPVLLNERNIIVSTIVVFDEQGKFILEEGEEKDYFVRIIGDRVEIYRSPFGRIREGDVVLVDYHFRTLPSMRYATNTKVFSAGITFGWLSLSYRVNRHDQDLLAGAPQHISSLQDLFSRASQVKLTLRGTNAGMSFFAEHKIYESRTLAFRLVDVRYAFFLKPLSSITLSSNFTLSLLNHTREAQNIKAYALGSELRWRPSRYFSFQAFGKYRMRQETIKADERTYEFGGSLQRFWRVIRLELLYEQRKWEYGLRLIDERRITLELERIF